MKILMIEAEDTILQDVVTFLNEKTSCHVRNLSLTTESLNVLTFSGLEIHLQEQMVIHNGDHIPLSHYEFQTLAYLAQHPGWVFSKEQIYEAVWKENPKHCGSAVVNVISQLRRVSMYSSPIFRLSWLITFTTALPQCFGFSFQTAS